MNTSALIVAGVVAAGVFYVFRLSSSATAAPGLGAVRNDAASPRLPAMPRMPDMPTMPGMPTMPRMGNTPNAPQLHPNTGGMPTAPAGLFTGMWG